jgi:hypothetical protein
MQETLIKTPLTDQLVVLRLVYDEITHEELTHDPTAEARLIDEKITTRDALQALHALQSRITGKIDAITRDKARELATPQSLDKLNAALALSTGAHVATGASPVEFVESTEDPFDIMTTPLRN